MITLTVNSTHFYLIDCRGGKLLVDAGWSITGFIAQMKTFQVSFAQIRWVMFTHHHPDHAGLVQEVRERSGAGLIIHPAQIPYLADLASFAAKKGGVKPIQVTQTDLVNPTPTQLAAIGLSAEILATPGHSPDSISLLLASGEAFIGDLTAPEMVDPETETGVEVVQSWRELLDKGARMFYHSHAPPVSASQVRQALSAL